MIIGERIREYRRKNNLTQDELAKALGVSKTMISDYETGKKAPRMNLFLKLVDTLGMSADYALGRDVNVVCEAEDQYGEDSTVHIAKQELTFLRLMRNSPLVYKKVYQEPSRALKWMESILKD